MDMAVNKIKTEQEWQAESDAAMMANYQEMLDDKPRLRRALAQAKKEEERLNKRAKAMSRVANMDTKSAKK